MPALLDKRLIVVTGKGGTGKSTVAMALGMLAARRGLRTIVAEVASQDRAARAFERDAPLFREQELAPGLWTISIAPERAMAEYLKVKAGAAGDLLASSRTFGLFAAATPGMRELLTIGKVWELAQLERRTRGAARYDVVILDAPATGHGVGIMRTPKTFADLSKVGPISQQGRAIHASLSDPDFTGVLAVARPEEMAVAETLALGEALRSELGMELDRVVVNGLFPERFNARERRALASRAQNLNGTSKLGRAALRAALSERTRVERQREQLERLTGVAAAPPIRLPFVFAPELELEDIENLSTHLEELG